MPGKPTTDHIASLVDMFENPSLVPGGLTLRSLGGGGGGSIGESRYMTELYLRERGDAKIRTQKDLNDELEAADRQESGRHAAARRGGGGGEGRERNPMTLDNANRWLTRFAVQQIVLQAMEDMKLDAMIMPDRQHPAVHPRPAARADAQRPRAVDLELPRHAGISRTRRPGGMDDAGLRPRARRLGAGRHAADGSHSCEAAAVGDVLRPAVQRADAVQDRGGV